MSDVQPVTAMSLGFSDETASETVCEGKGELWTHHLRQNAPCHERSGRGRIHTPPRRSPPLDQGSNRGVLGHSRRRSGTAGRAELV